MKDISSILILDFKVFKEKYVKMLWFANYSKIFVENLWAFIKVNIDIDKLY